MGETFSQGSSMQKSSAKRATVTRETTVTQLLALHPEARALLRSAGISFIGRSASPLESIERVAKANGLDSAAIDALVSAINDAAAAQRGAAPPAIHLTPSAAAELRRLLAARPGKRVLLRIATDCGLYTYDLDFTAVATDNDVPCEASGVPFLVEKKMLVFLNGLTIDYRGGFVFENPNARSA